MTSKQKGFDTWLQKETDALCYLTDTLKSTDRNSIRYKKLLPEIRAQKEKVKLMAEQSKILGDWTFSSQTDYTPKEETWLSEFKIPLLALGVMAYILCS